LLGKQVDVRLYNDFEEWRVRMKRTILVSDLHVESWDEDRLIGPKRRTRKEHFFKFLDWCQNDGDVQELIINGDLMDMPPYKGFLAFQDENRIPSQVIRRLLEFAKTKPITFIAGNHDIAMGAFRHLGAADPTFRTNINFWYPQYVLHQGDSTILIEHGHSQDPLFRRYRKDLLRLLYPKDNFESLAFAFQRRIEENSKPLQKAGVIQPVPVEPGKNAYWTIRDKESFLPEPTLWSKIKDAFVDIGDEMTEPQRMGYFFWRAKRQMRKYISDCRSRPDETMKPTLYQLYGHTHCADARGAHDKEDEKEKMDMFTLDGVRCIYINSGSWIGDSDDGWYVDINEDGKAWLQEWINEPLERKEIPAKIAQELDL
jgi:UDP-2,3-diacylglucosamine pyrophosphatase LpxH